MCRPGVDGVEGGRARVRGAFSRFEGGLLVLAGCAVQLGEAAGLRAVGTAGGLAIADETEVEGPVGRHGEM